MPFLSPGTPRCVQRTRPAPRDLRDERSATEVSPSSPWRGQLNHVINIFICLSYPSAVHLQSFFLYQWRKFTEDPAKRSHGAADIVRGRGRLDNYSASRTGQFLVDLSISARLWLGEAVSLETSPPRLFRDAIVPGRSLFSGLN